MWLQLLRVLQALAADGTAGAAVQRLTRVYARTVEHQHVREGVALAVYSLLDMALVDLPLCELSH